MKRILIILLAACAALNLAARSFGSVSGPDHVACYGMARFDVTMDGGPASPWLAEEAALDMLLTSPSGREIALPCFWVEGTRFQARFTPQEKGRYLWRFRYREGDGTEIFSDGGTLRATAPHGHGMLHCNDMWTLRHDDGTLYRGVGENICWESRAKDDSKFFRELHENADKYNYDVMLREFAAAGGNFCRMWMCSWNFPIDRHGDFNNLRYTPSEEYYNPSAVKRLDDVVALAEGLDVKIMLCMGPGDVPTGRDFFVSDAAKARYRNRLRYIVARWGYSPAIAMWEFFNEIDNVQFGDQKNPIPAAEIVAWHAEMARYLKQIDPYGHIVTTSISHRDIKGLNDIPDIDINQKHIYCATKSIPDNIAKYEKVHGKPYIIGEFGYEWDWSKNFDDFAGDMDIDFKRGLWYGLFSPTPVTPMSWWWEYFENRGLVPYFKAVRKVSDDMLASGRGSFEKVEVSAPGAEAYAVRCGKIVYIYAYNPTDKDIDAISLKMSGRRRVRQFDFACATFGKEYKVKAKGTLVIPAGLAPRGEVLFEIK